MLNLQTGSEEVEIPGNQIEWFVYATVTAAFFLSCHVSGFAFRIKQNTFVKVDHEFVNSTTAT